MKNREILRKAEILEDGISSEFWKDVSDFISQEINRVSAELIRGDFQELKEVYFLKGQLIGLAKPLSYPKKIIKRKNELEKEAEEKRKKKKGK